MCIEAVPVDSVELGLFYITTDLLKTSYSSSWNETLQNLADDSFFWAQFFVNFSEVSVVNIDE